MLGRYLLCRTLRRGVSRFVGSVPGRALAKIFELVCYLLGVCGRNPQLPKEAAIVDVEERGGDGAKVRIGRGVEEWLTCDVLSWIACRGAGRRDWSWWQIRTLVIRIVRIVFGNVLRGCVLQEPIIAVGWFVVREVGVPGRRVGVQAVVVSRVAVSRNLDLPLRGEQAPVEDIGNLAAILMVIAQTRFSHDD